jgi:hypothetical protein
MDEAKNKYFNIITLIKMILKIKYILKSLRFKPWPQPSPTWQSGGS